MDLELIKAGVFGLVVILILAIVNRRDDRAQDNLGRILQIAIANTAALTKMTETLEQLTEAVQKGAEISRNSAETVRDLVSLLKKEG